MFVFKYCRKFNFFNIKILKFDVCNRYIHKTKVINALFYEKDPKSGYKTKDPNISRIDNIRHGLKELKHEIALWKDEWKERLEMDPTIIYRPGEIDVAWKLDSQDALNQWVLTCDSDHSEGYSNCSLNLNSGRNAIFAGELNTKIPKDGRVQRAGYCNMRSLRQRKSFKRDSYLDWTSYNILVLKVRGDGRSYMLNLATSGYFDVMWNDVYNYALFTRGGPYWQLTKVLIDNLLKLVLLTSCKYLTVSLLILLYFCCIQVILVHVCTYKFS